MTDLNTTKINFLKELGTQNKTHSASTLLEHLIGVRDILKDMNAPEYVQDAGLFHSVYGTQSFRYQSTRDREKIVELIGEKAENLVFIFCTLSEPRALSISELDDTVVRNDLKLIDYANQTEITNRRNPEATWEEVYD